MTSLVRLVAAAARRRDLPDDTNAFRLVNAEGDGLPGLTVDWFAGVAVVSLYRPLSPAEEQEILDALLALPAAPRAIYLKRRPREARVVASTQKEALAPELPRWGAPVPSLVAREQGLGFEIRPGQGLSVGLYLDARDARAWVRARAAGASVLNCFAYTCGFAVAAWAGGATRAVNIDVSRRVLEWGKENARLNGQPADPASYRVGDVFEWLGRLGKRGERFDLVVLDPPSFATTRHSRFSAAADYGDLVARAVPVLARGGLLVCCCNLATLTAARFRGQVLSALTQAGRRGAVAASFGPSTGDFAPPPGTAAALKVLAVGDVE